MVIRLVSLAESKDVKLDNTSPSMKIHIFSKKYLKKFG